jgi:hypothetical protein
MDSFVGTMIFVIPGFLMYFWVQAFGVNPVMKHTPIEFTTVSALLWIPVSVTTLLFHNSLYFVLKWSGKIYQVWTIDELVGAAQKPEFLLWFLLLSVPVSCIFSAVWALYGMNKLRYVIN